MKENKKEKLFFYFRFLKKDIAHKLLEVSFVAESKNLFFVVFFLLKRNN